MFAADRPKVTPKKTVPRDKALKEIRIEAMRNSAALKTHKEVPYIPAAKIEVEEDELEPAALTEDEAVTIDLAQAE